MLSVSRNPCEGDLHEVPVPLVDGDREQERHGGSASRGHPVDAVEVGVGVADALGLRYDRVVVQDDDVERHLVQLGDIRRSQVGDYDALGLAAAYDVDPAVVQRREEGDAELLSQAEKGLRDDGRGRYPVGVVMRIDLDEIMAADDIRSLG